MAIEYTLLVSRNQTEAMAMRRLLTEQNIPAEVCRPPRHAREQSCGWAVRVASGQASAAARLLRAQGHAPCRVEKEEGV